MGRKVDLLMMAVAGIADAVAQAIGRKVGKRKQSLFGSSMWVEAHWVRSNASAVGWVIRRYDGKILTRGYRWTRFKQDAWVMWNRDYAVAVMNGVKVNSSD